MKTEPSGTTVKPLGDLTRTVVVVDDNGRVTSKTLAANEAPVEKGAASQGTGANGTTVELLSIFPGSPLSNWLDRLKREGFAPTLTRTDGRLIVTCRKQRRGLPGPIPKGCTVLMR